MTELALVRVEELPGTWPRVLPWIEPALARGGLFTAEYVRAEIDAGRMQLWCAVGPDVEAVALTKLVDYPLCRVFMTLVLTGRQRRRWQHHIATVEAWAKAHGASRVIHDARPGWERVLKARYRKTHVVLEREL